MRCPASKFATQCISHFLFLILLSAATFRLEERYDIHEADSTDERSVLSWLEQNFRPNNAIITHVQVGIVLWIAGKNTVKFRAGLVIFKALLYPLNNLQPIMEAISSYKQNTCHFTCAGVHVW